MAERSPVALPSSASASTSAFLTTFALVIASIAGLLIVDLWLARIDVRESRLYARHLFEDGQRLLAERRPDEAADRFASAQALERSNVRYGVALADALLADGRVDEAQVQLRSVLGRAETDASANLVMARILSRRRRLDDAAAFYHRAIYGEWAGDTAGQPLRARLELIDLLVRRGEKRRLLAELLPLQEIDPDSVELRRRLAHLFVLADSPGRALPLFRELLRRDPQDGDAYAGMGEVALLLGNFRTAKADLMLATRLLPDSTRLASLLDVADTVMALDPMARGVSHVERSARSRAILESTVDAVVKCGPTAAARELIETARVKLLAPTNRPTVDGEEPDALLDLASEIWSRQVPACPLDDTPTARALALIQSKLSR